jgi:hypothetical protein
MKLRTILVTTIVFMTLISTFIILPASLAKADDYDYNGIHWNGNSVGYDDQALDSTWRLELWQAKYTWSAAGADFYFYQDTGNSNYDLYIGDTYYEDSGAETNMSYSYPSMHITSCSTVFNEDMEFSVGGGGGTLDIETIALHEFGHWLRLEDLYSGGDSAKVMYYSYTGVKTSLHAGDVAGIIAIYGED